MNGDGVSGCGVKKVGVGRALGSQVKLVIDCGFGSGLGWTLMNSMRPSLFALWCRGRGGFSDSREPFFLLFCGPWPSARRSFRVLRVPWSLLEPGGLGVVVFFEFGGFLMDPWGMRGLGPGVSSFGVCEFLWAPWGRGCLGSGGRIFGEPP